MNSNNKEVIMESKLEQTITDLSKYRNCANCDRFKLFAGTDCVCVDKKEIVNPSSKCDNHRWLRDIV